MTFSQSILLTICRPLFNILFSLQVEGRENVPLTGSLILVSNHVHVLDPLLLYVSFPRWIRFVAKQELFHSPFLRPWLRWAGSLAVQRRGSVREKQKTLKSATNALGKGLVLGMFPEGSRSHDGKLRQGKPGSAFVASRTSVPVVPVGIVGTDKIRGVSWLWKRPRIVVRIGKPFSLPPASGKMSRSQMQLLTTQLMMEIAALLPSSYQGAYAKNKD